MNITVNDYMRMQPNYPNVADSDKYYLQLAVKLDSALGGDAAEALHMSATLKRDVALAAIGYFQDIVADCGIWRSFITIHKHLYGTPLPFYTLPQEYCESELNKEDLQFIIWYVIECQSQQHAQLSPFNTHIEQLAQQFFSILDAEYLNAPTPTEYTMAMDVELDNIGQVDTILKLSSWLFWHSYLMRHAAKEAINEAHTEARQIIAQYPDPKKASPHLSDLNDRVMLSNTTGPLALTVGQWLKMIVDGELPESNEQPNTGGKPHKFFAQLTRATGGEPISFFASYDALESFLSDDMGWGAEPQGHLPHLRHYDNFVIFGTPQKGILIAHDVAQYIKHPQNPCYDATKAQANGHLLITQRGLCPIDLVKHVFSQGLVPDVRLPYDPQGDLLNSNWDFLARLYQQRFYDPE
ncbi:MAG: DUF3843 family protein [Muribaculaceae bacterium]